MTAPTNIPYEKQNEPLAHRGCGAACLAMVYRSFGKEVTQEEIWPLIAKENRFGSIASTTHLMALHASTQGFQAIVLQTRHPLQVLRQCREGGVRAILNVRLTADAYAGHFVTMVDLDDTHVVLHDPLLGPSRRLSHIELLSMWHSQVPNSEILGNVVIGIASGKTPLPPCEFCRTTIPERVDCPRCRKAVGLQPASLLGCIHDGCIARLWNYICCPSCDYVWSFNQTGASVSLASDQAVPESDLPPIEPQNFDMVFAQLDKFTAYVRGIPGIDRYPEVQAHLAVLEAGKTNLKLADAESMGYHKIRQDQMATMKKDSQQKQEAHKKKTEALNTPSPPLDGDALGHALLKNLGFK
jgi:hypothetical protein